MIQATFGTIKKCLHSLLIIFGYAIFLVVALLPVALIYKFYPKILFNGTLLERVRQWRKRCEASVEAVWSGGTTEKMNNEADD